MVSVKHGHSSSPAYGGISKTYSVWVRMRERCYRPKNARYAAYGGRGIAVCARWRNSFINFLKDMGEKPEGKSLDRKNNDKGYSKANCRWATRYEQQQNMRSNHNLTYSGETHCINEWARRTGLQPLTLWFRISRGWTVHRALNTPTQR